MSSSSPTQLRRRFKDSISSTSSLSSTSSDDSKTLQAKRHLKINSQEPIAEPAKAGESPAKTIVIYGSTLFILAISLCFRLMVALHSYSGAGVPPKFGDFEAQRHWMEITVNTPLNEWYVATEANDLSWWGLDYPPLSAYWAYLTGKVAQKFNPDWVALITSRGLETDDLKTFMRATVIVSDLLFMISGAFALARKIPGFSRSHLLLMLLTPAFLLIDHGHFQYNNVMLGLTLWAVSFFASRKYVLAVICLFSSLAFKQMNMYAVPAFGAALLGLGAAEGSPIGVLSAYARWGLAAIFTLLAAFAPFLQSFDSIKAVLLRLFPVGRGLFEEKVGNAWCTISIFTKIHRRIPKTTLFQWCLISVTLALLPMILGLIGKGAQKRLNLTRFLLGLSYCCLAMFMFSYHVHEKQILIPLLPISFLSTHSVWFVYFFTLWSTFSLYPLMRKDGLQIAYFATLIAWTCLFLVSFGKRLQSIPAAWKFFIIASIDFIVLNHVAQAVWTPPASLPDLFLVLNTVSCSGAFGLALLYLLHQFFSQ